MLILHRRKNMEIFMKKSLEKYEKKCTEERMIIITNERDGKRGSHYE